MAMTSCRECGQPVSTEASACPHCGVGSPARVPSDAAAPDVRAPGLRWLAPPGGMNGWLGLCILAGLACIAWGGYQVGQDRGWFSSGTVDATQVESTISQHFTEVTGHPVTAQCGSISAKKGKISDCTATRSDTGKSTPVFVTMIDGDGHYTIQAGDPFAIVGP